MKDSPEIITARAEVDRMRSRLMSTMHDLRQRLRPKTLARNGWQGAKEKGADLAENTVDAVRTRPFAATGVVAMISMFLAREPLMALGAKIVGRSNKTARKNRKAMNETETAQ